MSKKRKDWRLYLLDMLECIKRIENYVEGLSYEQFLMDDKTKDAVVRNIEIIGEAARNIPKEIQTRYSHIPWAEIISTRHVIAHDYFDLDYEITWSIIVQDIPVLKSQALTFKPWESLDFRPFFHNLMPFLFQACSKGVAKVQGL